MSVDRLKKGMATLPIVIILSVIILEVATALAMIAADLSSAANNQRLAAQALSDAKTGADDTFMSIVRHKPCPGTIGCLATSTINIGPNDVANVTMSPNVQGVITITSEGVSLNRHRKLQMVVGVDNSTGLVNVESIQEIAN